MLLFQLQQSPLLTLGSATFSNEFNLQGFRTYKCINITSPFAPSRLPSSFPTFLGLCLCLCLSLSMPLPPSPSPKCLSWLKRCHHFLILCVKYDNSKVTQVVMNAALSHDQWPPNIRLRFLLAMISKDGGLNRPYLL